MALEDLKGSLAHMSPEQIVEGEVDRRSDLFAAGIILHELLAGCPLFTRETEIETVYRVLEALIPTLPEARGVIPKELAQVVQTALERDPARRFFSAREMSAANKRCTSVPHDPSASQLLRTLLAEACADEPTGHPLT